MENDSLVFVHSCMPKVQQKPDTKRDTRGSEGGTVQDCKTRSFQVKPLSGTERSIIHMGHYLALNIAFSNRDIPSILV